MNLSECFKKGLLVKRRVSKETVENTAQLAEHTIERAEGNLNIRYFDVAFALAYQAMLHAARALLFSDGIKERSHACVVVYLKDKYGKDPQLTRYLNILDSYRISRHEVVYRGGYVSREEASNAIEDAKNLLIIVNNFLSHKHQAPRSGSQKSGEN